MINRETPLKWVSQMIQILHNTTKEYEAAYNQVNVCDNILVDIEHYIEMTNFNAAMGYKLSKQIKETRIMRRENKDMVYILEPLYELVNKNKKFIDELKKCQGEMQRRMNKLNNRAYAPRTTVIAEEFKKAAEEKGIRLVVNK